MAPHVYSRPHGRPHGSSAPLVFARARARRREDELGVREGEKTWAGSCEIRRSEVTRNVAVQRRSIARVPMASCVSESSVSSQRRLQSPLAVEMTVSCTSLRRLSGRGATEANTGRGLDRWGLGAPLEGAAHSAGPIPQQRGCTGQSAISAGLLCDASAIPQTKSKRRSIVSARFRSHRA
eukprot:214960-Prymnesium_polylepis.1